MKTLRQVFATSSEEELDRIAQWWGVGNRPKEGWLQNMGKLAQLMAQPIAARFAWEQLSLIERKVLHHALSIAASDGVMRDLLFKLTRLDAETFAAALVTLQEHLLLVEEQVLVKTGRAISGVAATKKAPSELTLKLGVPREILAVLGQIEREIYTPKQDHSNWKLEQILTTLDMNRINQISANYGFGLGDFFSRSDPRTRMAQQLVQQDTMFYAWDQLDGTARKLCKWLVEANGAVNMNAAREYTGFDNPTLASAITKLEDYAIAFDTFVEHERRLFIPRELLRTLKQAIQQGDTSEETGEVGLVPLKAQPISIHQEGPLALYDLTTIIGASFQQNMEPTQGGYIPKRIANKLAPQMQIKLRLAPYEQDNLNVDMIFTLASELNLLKLSRSEDNAKPRYVEGKALRQWMLKSEVDMVRELVGRWPKSRQWIDIAGANYKDDSYNSFYYMNFEAGRSEFLTYLSTCQPGKWYSIASLLKTIRQEKPYLLRNRYYQTGVTGYRSAKAMLANWYQVDGEILIGMLSSSLYEMGIVALGYEQHQPSTNGDRPVNPVAFMVTELGAAALGVKSSAQNGSAPAPGEAAPAQAQGKRGLIVQPNFELLLLQPDMPTLYRLLPFAQVAQVGIVSRLTLTRASLLRGLEHGRNIEQILQTLAECSQNELPQNVVYTLKDWARAYKEASISQVFLVETPNESMGDDLAAMEQLKQHGLRRLGPCIFITSNDTNFQELRRLLEKHGIVTRVHGEVFTQTARPATTSRWR